MSAFASEPARSDEEKLYSAPDGNEIGRVGQRHDRISIEEQDASNMATNRTGSGAGGNDISAGQKMISATWGSVLTSLLGKST